MTLVGRTALSVEIITKEPTPAVIASSRTVRVPKTLFFTPSMTFFSRSGTCL